MSNLKKKKKEGGRTFMLISPEEPKEKQLKQAAFQNSITSSYNVVKC